jgi:hypothetical protein
MRRSTYGFCQGDLGEIGRSRILSLLKTRFERIDGVVRQGLDTRQCLRIVRLAVCALSFPKIMSGRNGDAADVTVIKKKPRRSGAGVTFLRRIWTTLGGVGGSSRPSNVALVAMISHRRCQDVTAITFWRFHARLP